MEALAALGLALLTGLAGTSWQWQRAEKRGAEARAQQYGLLLARASAERRSGVVGQQFATITALRQAAQMRPGERELRDEAITALALLDYNSTPWRFIRMVRCWPRPPGMAPRNSTA